MPGVAARTPPSSTSQWPGLASALAKLDDDRLARLLALRPDLARPAPRDLNALAARVGAWPSARDCFFDLDRSSQQVVEALCLLPQPTTVDTVASLLGVPADDAELVSALRRLEERALSFRYGTTIRVLPALGHLDHPARLGPPLAAVLGRQIGPSVDDVARRIGAGTSGRNRAATLARIAEVLADADHVVRLIDAGPAGTADLAGRVATVGPLVSVTTGMYRIDDRTPAGWLLNRGMLGVVDYVTAVMPREPAITLRHGRVFPPGCLRRPEQRGAPVATEQVDRAAAERAQRLVADVAAVLDEWDEEPPVILKTGGLGIREVRRAAKIVQRTEAEAALVVELIGITGLTRVDMITGNVLPTPSYDEWEALDTPARWARLAAAWVDADIHLGAAGSIGTKGKPIPPLLHRAGERHAARRRHQVLSVLERVPHGTALQAGSLLEQVGWEGPSTWAGGPAPRELLVAWFLGEADLVGLTAHGSLSTVGRAVAGGRHEEAVGALTALLPPTVTEFVVQADLTAIVAGEPAPMVRSELDLMADVESTGAATVYRFTEASVRRAFDAGRTSADILTFLEGHASRGVPQPLTYLVTDLGRRFGNVRVGAATTYLRSDDTSLLAEVLGARRTAHLRLRQLAPTVLVTHADGPSVVAALQAAGYLPASEGPDGSLQLARRGGRRLDARPVQSRPGADPPDLALIVAGLRRTPPPPLAPPTTAPSPSPAPSPSGMLPGVARPAAIAREPRAIRTLLGQACDEYWLVRMAYLDQQGRTAELTVEPADVDGENLYASCFPTYDDRTFVVDRIEWARVLTEAEEELLP